MSVSLDGYVAPIDGSADWVAAGRSDDGASWTVETLSNAGAHLVGAIDRLGNEALRADEPDTDSDDVADHGTDAFERNMTLGLMENEARTLQQIEEALEQMATGRYGICTQCGTAIPLVRLEALPFATTCVPCQEKAERRF